ncbi:hypothetical protein J6590_002738 [Homalodisca vitripennis]|nr:hypothetical protein J6590_002738 [Homalodisca vitripennis]
MLQNTNAEKQSTRFPLVCCKGNRSSSEREGGGWRCRATAPPSLYAQELFDKAEDRDEITENEEELQLGEQMPAMRHDIFNLDHERIMNKVMKSLQKSRALHRFQPNLEIDCKGSGTKSFQVPVANMTKQERKEALARFILERKILQEKRRQNKFNSELNVYNIKENEDDDEDGYEDEDFVEQDLTEEYLDDYKIDKTV